jgi:hypothetical protein
VIARGHAAGEGSYIPNREKNMKRHLCILVSLMLSTMPLLAAGAANIPKSPALLGVYDSQGIFVGTAFDFVWLWRDFGTGSGPNMLEYSIDGLLPLTLLYYTSTDCTGQAYVDARSLPIHGSFDGTHLFVAGPLTHVTVQSEFFATSPTNGSCLNAGPPLPMTAGPAIQIDPSVQFGWKTPFSLK